MQRGIHVFRSPCIAKRSSFGKGTTWGTFIKLACRHEVHTTPTLEVLKEGYCGSCRAGSFLQVCGRSLRQTHGQLLLSDVKHWERPWVSTDQCLIGKRDLSRSRASPCQMRRLCLEHLGNLELSPWCSLHPFGRLTKFQCT